jgi:dihydrofolate synthase / folylpolyglutamate synthase
MRSPAEAWIGSLDPWPEEFGLAGIRALLAEVGDPQRAFPAVHVVGTNGKSTATRTIEALLEAEGLEVGAYTSPHVHGWAERIRIGGAEADFEDAVEAVRDAAMRLGSTQFEALTAAALAAFARAGVDVAVVEAGLGGRYDATNVLDTRVVLLTNVALEHTEVLGGTRESIAAEKLAVVRPGVPVVLGEPEWEKLARANGAATVRSGGSREAAEAFLGRPIEAEVEVVLPGRLEVRAAEVWDGAHTPDAVDWLLDRLPARDYVVCVSVLADKDVEGILSRLSRASVALVATRCDNARALPARELARRAVPFFERVETVGDPEAAVARARDLAGEDGRVLVTGSLYLLADLSLRQVHPIP